MEFYLKILLFCGFISNIQGQVVLTGCPRKWIYNSPNCYLFVADDPVVFEEADAACYNYGGTLLSINDFSEHRFIAEWLEAHDILPPSTWLTSGYLAQRTVLWESDNKFIHQGEQQWVVNINQWTEGRVAYKYGGAVYRTYGWTNVSASIPYNYICEVPQSEAAQIDVQQRGEDFGFGIIDPRDVPRGPILVEQPGNIIVVRGELSVFLECTSSGNPYPTFTWWRLRRGEIVQVTSEMDTRYTLSGGRFTIEDPKDKDIAQYRCKATNEYGTLLSKFAKIQFGFLGEFPPVEPTDYRAKAFRGIRVDCNTPSFYPEVRFEWSKFGTAAWLFPGGSYTFVSQAGWMYFSELQPTDEKEYFCFVTLAAPKNYRMNTKQPPSAISKGVWVRVIDQTDATPFGPDIKTHAFPSPALKGHTLRLECIAYGTLPLSYTWRRRDGRPMVRGTRIHDRNRVLTIDEAPLSAEGEYICRCNGKNGVAEKTITVSMESAPYFPYSIGDKFVDPAQLVKWRCKAVARPRAQYVWYKNGEVLSSEAGVLEVTGNILVIFSVDQDRDEGMYQCSATNVHGTTYSAGRLKVMSFVPNFDKHPLAPFTLAPVGGKITIPCMVEAAPIPQVSWLKNGGDLNLIPGDVSQRIGMLLTFDLVLSEITYGDAGIYTCKASNINGEASNTTRVEVVAGVVITSPPVPSIVRVNKTTFLNCHAAYNYEYDVTYQWKFNGYLIDFHLHPEYILGDQSGVYGLYLTRAQFEHTGVYECTALTTLHSDSRSAVLTVIGPPGPCAGAYVQDHSVTPYSARLVWTIGAETDHGDPIISYDVEGETDYHPGQWTTLMTDVPEYIVNQEAINLGRRTDQRSLEVTGLIPHTGYRFRIRAINTFGRAELPSTPTVTVKTPETAPVIAPRHVSGGGGKVGTLTITWEPLDIAEHSGPGLGYNVFYKLHEEQQRGFKKKKILDRDARRYYEDRAEQVERIVYTVTIGPDNYYLQYDVKVGTYNDHGDGPNSTASIIYSAEGMPVARPKMNYNPERNATAVYVKWHPVADNRETMKGRVGGYTVQYFESDGDFTPWEGFEPDFIIQKEVYGQTDTCLIIGLKPVTEYYSRVQVWNSAGRGPKGEWRRSETRHAPPSDYPTFVYVYPRSEHSVYVRWRGISTRSYEESLEGYIVRVWKIQEDIRTANDTKVDKVTEAVIENLQRQTVYVLRVMGYSWGGEGQKSESVYFTVLGGRVPFDPATSRICHADFEDRTCDGAESLNISLLLILLLFSAATILIRH